MSKRITLPGAPPAGGGVPIALRFVGSGKEVPLPEDQREFTIGFDPVSFLILQDEFVSAMHCVLTRNSPTTLLVHDRNSRNGTRVNGARVRECEVGVGGRITIGETTMIVVGSRPHERQSAAAQLIGEDAHFREAIGTILRTAGSSASQLAILIRGESGTGKELLARLVHEASGRNEGPFVAVNCGAVPRGLVESEFFGHEKGAFTGAEARHRGVFEQAHGGTLFLDEIGELPIEMQPRLLRVLETRRLKRVGGENDLSPDVRVVAATHRDLRAACDRGEFRPDLYHRLAGIEVRLPALRERPGDIPALAQKFVADFAVEVGARTLAPDTLAVLQTHDWPGNARELRNALYRAAMFSTGEIRADQVRAQLRAHSSRSAAEPRAGANAPAARETGIDGVIGDMVREAMARSGSIRIAARSIGMAKSTFHDHARRLGLLKPAKRGAS